MIIIDFLIYGLAVGAFCAGVYAPVAILRRITKAKGNDNG